MSYKKLFAGEKHPFQPLNLLLWVASGEWWRKSGVKRTEWMHFAGEMRKRRVGR